MNICLMGDAQSVHIRRWCEYFRDKGHRVSLISFREDRIDGVDVVCVGDKLGINSEGGNAQYLKKVFKIKKIIDNINPDLVNAHYLTSYGLIAALINKRPLVISTWGSDILVTPNKNVIYKLITKYAIKKSDLLTSDSDFMSSEIIKLGGYKEKVLTVPMGVNVEEFDVTKRCDTDIITFTSMRTICKNSNIDIIIKAFSLINNKFPNTKMILTNTGDKEEEIKRLIYELNLEDKIEYKGFVNANQLKDILLKSQVYISIPTSDSTSVTLLEAMASGTIPIVSDLPANKEWIEDDKNGYILKDINSVIELEEIMAKVIQNNELFHEIKRINRNIIEERAVWMKNMDSVNQKYLNLIK